MHAYKNDSHISVMDVNDEKQRYDDNTTRRETIKCEHPVKTMSRVRETLLKALTRMVSPEEGAL